MRILDAEHMEPTKPMKIVLWLLAVAMAATWALVMWVASVVTDTMLRVLQYVVDLAQLS